MRIESGRLPSVGFVAIVASLAATVAFFAWGLAQPPLDRVWEIHHQMKIGEMKRLHAADRELLRREMAHHRDLATDLLDGQAIGIVSAHRNGWLLVPTATMIRTPASSAVRSLVIEVRTPQDLLPIRLVASGDSWRDEREVSAHGPVTVPLPPLRGAPEIVEVTAMGKGLGDDPSTLGLRIAWEAER